MGTAALRYAKQGWQVFPTHSVLDGACSCQRPDCESPAKHPRTQKGLLDATSDRNVIEAWWATWPDANIGVRTGEVSGIAVIDIDLKNDGPAQWAALQAQHGGIETLTAATGGGGQHLVFATLPAQKLRSGSNVLGRGLDTRGEGGYIIAPPSVHISGNRYQWVNRTTPISVPKWVAWPLFQVEASVKNGSKSPAHPDHPQWVSEALAKGVGQGERNALAARLAGYFHQKGLPKDIIIQVMEPFAERCQPPMGLHELLRTIESVRRYQVHVNQAEIVDPPTFREESTALVYTWENPGICINIDHLHRNTQGLHCEITILSTEGGGQRPIHGPVNYNMTSTSSRENLLRYLNKRWEINWTEPLETLSRLCSAHLRAGEPIVDLREYMQRPHAQWALAKLILDDQPTILFGPGGTGKSLISLAAMVSLDLGLTILGLSPTPGHHGIYLDWESTSYEHGGRYRQIMEGAGASAEEHEMLHLPCAGPLSDNATRIKQHIDTKGVTFAILDSAGYACGGEGPEKSDSVLRFFEAVRFLKIPTLIIAHDTKVGSRGMPFGSVYWHNAARSTWEIKNQRVAGENTLRVGLFHRKSNVSKLEKPLGFSIEFSEPEISFTAIDVQGVPELAKETNIPDQIAAVLSDGALDILSIGDELGMTEDKQHNQIRSILNKGKGRFVRVELGIGPAKWGLAHHD